MTSRGAPPPPLEYESAPTNPPPGPKPYGNHFFEHAIPWWLGATFFFYFMWLLGIPFQLISAISLNIFLAVLTVVGFFGMIFVQQDDPKYNELTFVNWILFPLRKQLVSLIANILFAFQLIPVGNLVGGLLYCGV